ncbi:MAG: hypothetical protein ACPL4C_07130, partial [Brevinematia bacterium]
MKVRIIYLFFISIFVLYNFSYAFTGYKTGLILDKYYLLNGVWDGRQWTTSVKVMKVVRDPSGGGLKVEEEKTVDVKVPLPNAPNQTKNWYMLYSKEYASILNDALSSALKNILNSQEDSSSRIVADLVFNTTDGYKMHYIATHDGNNGYRSYGFQIPSDDVKDGKENLTNSFYMATFSYYPKTFNSDLPLPSSNSPLIQNPDIQRKLGSYDYVVYTLNGEIVEQKNGVNVGGRYDSKNDNDNTGLNLFINEVILPVMNKYNLSYATFRYMYAPRLTTDENGNYKYTVAVTERVIEVGCADKGGYYDSKTGNCVYSGVKRWWVPADEVDFQILMVPAETYYLYVYYDERIKVNRIGASRFEFTYLVFPGIVYCDNGVNHGYFYNWAGGFYGHGTDLDVGTYINTPVSPVSFSSANPGIVQQTYSPHVLNTYTTRVGNTFVKHTEEGFRVTYTYYVGNKSLYYESFAYENDLPFWHEYVYFLTGGKLLGIGMYYTGDIYAKFQGPWILGYWYLTPDRTRYWWESRRIQDYINNGGNPYNLLYPDEFFTGGGYYNYLWSRGLVDEYWPTWCYIIPLDGNYGITAC